MRPNRMSKRSPTKKERFCEYCNKFVVGSVYKFNSHLFTHNAVKAKYRCEYCPKKYFRKDVYNLHLKRHNTTRANQKKFICDYCDRGFVNKFNLVVHLKNIHDDCINPEYVKFSCKVCEISFCENRILKNHIRKHHFNNEVGEEPSHFKRLKNEKWIECTVNNAYVEMTKINNNVITIRKISNVENIKIKKEECKTGKLYVDQFSNQYSKAICDYCGKEMIKKSLRMHIREKHTKIKKFACKVCKKGFSRHYLLIAHECGKSRKRRKKGTKKKVSIKSDVTTLDPAIEIPPENSQEKRSIARTRRMIYTEY